MYHYYFYFFMRLLFIICIFPFTLAHAEPFTINVIEAFQGHTQQAELEDVLTKLYAPLNITPKFVYYPSKRGLLLVNQGVLDAEAGRFESTVKDYPKLIKVDEALNVFHSGVYCVSKEDCELSADANIIAHSSFQSATIFCELMKFRCRFESSPLAIARMLEKKIAQGFLSSTSESNKVLCAIKSDKVYYHNVPSLIRFSYHFVNKRHALLVPKLEHSMRQLKRQGILPNSKLDSTPKHAACGKHVIPV